MISRFALKSIVFAAALASLAACAQVAKDGHVVDVAAQSGNFTTLIAAAAAADIITPMTGKGPFTVFAPTDAAFADLPDGALEELLLPENKQQLTAMLTYHVVPGAVTAEQMTGQRLHVATINGSDLLIDGRDGLKAGPANVITPDIRASNGIIHAIDKVLMP